MSQRNFTRERQRAKELFYTEANEPTNVFFKWTLASESVILHRSQRANDFFTSEHHRAKELFYTRAKEPTVLFFISERHGAKELFYIEANEPTKFYKGTSKSERIILHRSQWANECFFFSKWTLASESVILHRIQRLADDMQLIAMEIYFKEEMQMNASTTSKMKSKWNQQETRRQWNTNEINK